MPELVAALHPVVEALESLGIEYYCQVRGIGDK